MVKRYEELTISDDFIFGKAMEDKVLCHDMNAGADVGKTCGNTGRCPATEGISVYGGWQAGAAGYVCQGPETDL